MVAEIERPVVVDAHDNDVDHECGSAGDGGHNRHEHVLVHVERSGDGFLDEDCLVCRDSDPQTVSVRVVLPVSIAPISMNCSHERCGGLNPAHFFELVRKELVEDRVCELLALLDTFPTIQVPVSGHLLETRRRLGRLVIDHLHVVARESEGQRDEVGHVFADERFEVDLSHVALPEKVWMYH